MSKMLELHTQSGLISEPQHSLSFCDFAIEHVWLLICSQDGGCYFRWALWSSLVYSQDIFSPHWVTKTCMSANAFLASFSMWQISKMAYLLAPGIAGWSKDKSRFFYTASKLNCHAKIFGGTIKNGSKNISPLFC